MPGLLLSLLSVFTLIVIITGLRKVLNRLNWQSEKKQKTFFLIVVSLIVWMVVIGFLAASGAFNHFGLPPRPALVILFPLPFVLVFAFSKSGLELLKATPPQWLIFIQTFRILVEILLWLAFKRSLLPVQMTFEGRNFDVLTGILAIPVAYYCFIKKSWPRAIAVLWNFVGIALLLNILIIAVLSMPTPIRYFMNEPANTIVAQFPFIYLPGVLVVIAYSMHIFSLRQLFITKSLRA